MQNTLTNQPPNPIEKGEVRNPDGRRNTPGRKAVRKLQRALDMAIELLGNVEHDGVRVLAGKIKAKLDTDPIGTIRALAPLFPKDVHIDIAPLHSLSQLTDSEIMQEIEHRANTRLEHDITPHITVVDDPN